jgi:hypothetical protein
MNNQEIKTRRHVKYVLENYPQSRGSSGEFMIFFINVFTLGRIQPVSPQKAQKAY